jgi:hypothetical protein
VGPSHKQRFLACDAAGAPPASAGALLTAARRELFASAAFAKLLWSLTELRVTSSRSLARRFRPGLDYTVAHYGILTQAARLDATLAFCDDASEGAREAWQSGEVGGFECYLTADEAGEAGGAADVYRADPEAAEEDQVLSVSAAANTLSLVHRCARAAMCSVSSAPFCLLARTLRLSLLSPRHTPGGLSLYRQPERGPPGSYVSYAGCAHTWRCRNKVSHSFPSNA